MSADADHPTHTPRPSVSGKISAGQAFGKYRIVRPVGVGGMAQVFLASREGPEGFAKRYVIKRILPQLAHDEQFARMFVTEAKVAAMLDHPNIVHVFDFEIEHGNFYLVMEYVSGASLANVLRANRRKGVPLGSLIAVEIGVAVAHALAYAHDVTLPDGKPLDLVHRDISPGNILLSLDGAVKLADFGVVKTSLSATEVGVVNGKWAYMSPEQITGEAVDRRSDLFSLGIVLYEIITGMRLFRAENAAATASRVMELEVPRPARVVPDLDPRLDYIVMKLLERDLKARYQNAGELAADLHSAARITGVLGRRDPASWIDPRFFPDRTSTPVLGSSMNGGGRLSPVQAHVSLGPAPAAGEPALEMAAASTVLVPESAEGVFANPSARPSDSGVSRALVIAIITACLIGSVVFWLILF